MFAVIFLNPHKTFGPGEKCLWDKWMPRFRNISQSIKRNEHEANERVQWYCLFPNLLKFYYKPLWFLKIVHSANIF